MIAVMCWSHIDCFGLWIFKSHAFSTSVPISQSYSSVIIVSCRSSWKASYYIDQVTCVSLGYLTLAHECLQVGVVPLTVMWWSYTGILRQGQVIHASAFQPGVTDIRVHMKRFNWFRNALRDLTLMIIVFLRTHWSIFFSRAHYNLQWIFSLMDSASVFLVLTLSRSCHKVGEFLHFVLTFSIDLCMWLRSDSLLVFTVSTSSGGSMPHGYCMHRFVM